MNKILADLENVRDGQFFVHYMEQLKKQMDYIGGRIVNERIGDENILEKAFLQGRYAGLKEAMQLPDGIEKKLSQKESTGDTANLP